MLAACRWHPCSRCGGHGCSWFHEPVSWVKRLAVTRLEINSNYAEMGGIGALRLPGAQRYCCPDMDGRVTISVEQYWRVAAIVGKIADSHRRASAIAGDDGGCGHTDMQHTPRNTPRRKAGADRRAACAACTATYRARFANGIDGGRSGGGSGDQSAEIKVALGGYRKRIDDRRSAGGTGYCLSMRWDR